MVTIQAFFFAKVFGFICEKKSNRKGR